MHDTILSTVGSPLVKIPGPPGATVAGKVEAANPSGSVKIRPAIGMIRRAESTGEIEPGDRLVEATSGNTGIGLALVSAVLGYDLTIVMPESVSTERRRLLRAYGATLDLVDGEMADAKTRADSIARESDGFVVSQFDNRANPDSHYETTAVEILEQIGDRRLDAFVAPVGTGGTVTGTARRLCEAFPDLTVVGVEPASNPFLSTGEPADHDFQGMGPNFIPAVLDRSLIDRVESVALADAEAEGRHLARESGLLVGQSSGAASIAARRVATDLVDSVEEPLVVTVFPDSGERYLSVGIFD